jgi:hypothetical protein
MRQFRVTFRLEGSEDTATEKSFWGYLSELQIKRTGKGYEFSAEPTDFRTRFCRNLREKLITSLIGDQVSLDKWRPTRFAFMIDRVTYGSMTMELSVAGVKDLVELFDNNLDVFKVIFAQCAPAALIQSVDDLTLSADYITCEVDASLSLSRAFSEGNKPRKLGTSREVQERSIEAIKWAWVTSNTSLIIPAMLALAILYVAFQALQNDRKDLRESVLVLQKEQTEVLRLLTEQKEHLNSGSTARGDAAGSDAKK